MASAEKRVQRRLEPTVVADVVGYSRIMTGSSAISETRETCVGAA